MRAVEHDDRLYGDTGRLHVDELEGNAFLRLHVWVGAYQTEDPVGELRQGRPGLLAIDNVMTVLSHRAAFQVGEIGACSRLGIALAPPIVTGQNARQEFR